MSQVDAEFPRSPAVGSLEILCELLIESGFLRREQSAQGVVRRLRNRSFHRCIARRSGEPGIASIAARDCVDRVEYGDMHDRHRAARAGRPELLAENACFFIRHRRVIEAARVDRDFVPVSDHSPRGRIVLRRPLGGALRVGIVVVERSQRILHATGKSLRVHNRR